MDNKAVPALLPVYKRYDLAFERGEGAWLYTIDGRRILDFASGVAVTALGHAHPHLVAAVREQAGKLWHVSNLFHIPELERLADRLVAHSFADTVFVCNSGAEAMEACIKMARRYHWARGNPERHRIVTFEGAFHGRTMATVSAAGGKKLIEGFDPLLPGFDIVPFGDHDALHAAIGPETAAIMIEPIQGEGGIRPVPAQCLEGLRALCDEHDILLVFDEVQAGMGRTGTLLAYEQMGVTPRHRGHRQGAGRRLPGRRLPRHRARGLGHDRRHPRLDLRRQPAGLRGRQRRARRHAGRRLHGACRGARPAAARAAGGDPAPSIRRSIAEVRGRGLLVGLRLHRGSAEFIKALQGQGLVSVPAADEVVRLLPPLIIAADEIDQGCAMIEAVCRELAG